jgi:hypothetical protein
MNSRPGPSAKLLPRCASASSASGSASWLNTNCNVIRPGCPAALPELRSHIARGRAGALLPKTAHVGGAVLPCRGRRLAQLEARVDRLVPDRVAPGGSPRGGSLRDVGSPFAEALHRRVTYQASAAPDDGSFFCRRGATSYPQARPHQAPLASPQPGYVRLSARRRCSTSGPGGSAARCSSLRA